MFETEIRVETPDGGMTAFVAHPDDGGPFPVAVLFMDGIGYREQIKANARRFAAGGFYVAAPDLYHRSGEQLSFEWGRLGKPGYRAQLTDVLAQVTPARVTADTGAVLAAVGGDTAASPGPRVCVGYCMGARAALHVAASMPAFVAAAGIHPSALVTGEEDSPHLEAGDVRGEVYFAFAENDQSATAENVDRFREALARVGVAGVVERLPGTSHGFAMADLPVYDEAAAERHFERTLDLWRRSLAQETVGA